MKKRVVLTKRIIYGSCSIGVSKVGKAGKAAPHAEYIDQDEEEKKLKQEQARN